MDLGVYLDSATGPVVSTLHVAPFESCAWKFFQESPQLNPLRSESS